MTSKSSNLDTKFICECGKFIGNHIPEIVEFLGEERVKQLIDTWNKTKTDN